MYNYNVRLTCEFETVHYAYLALFLVVFVTPSECSCNTLDNESCIVANKLMNIMLTPCEGLEMSSSIRRYYLKNNYTSEPIMDMSSTMCQKITDLHLMVFSLNMSAKEKAENLSDKFRVLCALTEGINSTKIFTEDQSTIDFFKDFFKLRQQVDDFTQSNACGNAWVAPICKIVSNNSTNGENRGLQGNDIATQKCEPLGRSIQTAGLIVSLLVNFSLGMFMLWRCRRAPEAPQRQAERERCSSQSDESELRCLSDVTTVEDETVSIGKRASRDNLVKKPLHSVDSSTSSPSWVS